MKVALALPNQWQNDLAALSMVAASSVLPDDCVCQHIAPTDSGAAPANALSQADCGHADVLIVPISISSASWAGAVLQAAAIPCVLWVSDAATTPRLWPELGSYADGIVLPEAGWLSSVQLSQPRLPAMLALPTLESSSGVGGVSAAGPVDVAATYWLTWAPASDESISVILESFALALANCPATQLVVLGGAESESWHNACRTSPLRQYVWLLARDAYRRASELMREALVIVAPLAPWGRSTALLLETAKATDTPLVQLVEGEGDWVCLTQGVPRVALEQQQAAHGLSSVLQALLAASPLEAEALLAARHCERDDADAALRESLPVLLARATSHCNAAGHRIDGRWPAPDGDVTDYLVDLMIEATNTLGISTLTRDVTHDLAQAIAELTG